MHAPPDSRHRGVVADSNGQGHMEDEATPEHTHCSMLWCWPHLTGQSHSMCCSQNAQHLQTSQGINLNIPHAAGYLQLDVAQHNAGPADNTCASLQPATREHAVTPYTTATFKYHRYKLAAAGSTQQASWPQMQLAYCLHRQTLTGID